MTKTEFDLEQFSSAYPDGVENNYWTVARNLIIRNGLQRSGIKNKKILEIGCGRGGVVSFLRKSGFNAFGVELASPLIDKELSEYVKTDTDFVNLDSNFKDSIEAVLVLDVIEHLPDEITFLRKIKENFPKLESLVITVPGRMDIWSNYDLFYGHYRRYDLDKLNKTLSDSGFIPQTTTYFFHSLYFLAKVLLRVSRKRETKIKAPKGLFILIHKFLGIIFFLEYLFLPKRIYGSSIFSVSVKK